MTQPKSPVLVVGAGAAGILAAWRAATLGVPVTLLEKNSRIGLKILISGGGKCNVTHDGAMEEVRAAFRPNEARFLRPCFYRFTNRDIRAMLEKAGLSLYARPDGRLFPTEGTARDVVAMLQRYLLESGVELRTESPVRSLLLEEAGGHRFVKGVVTDEGPIHGGHVILTVGGSSYPLTGTTGDGWPWARSAGHTTVPLRAALAPLYLHEARPEWAGVALRDCRLMARQGKILASWNGDLLFTHGGLSGPCALGISREVAERLPMGQVTVEVDLFPSATDAEISSRLQQWAITNPRQSLSSGLQPFLTQRLVERFLEDAGSSGQIRGAELSQAARRCIVTQLKSWSLGGVKAVPLEKGEVVAGGVALAEVDPQTMASRKCRRLYLAGEILDIAGPVGGYNLQAAWSTGYVAGESAARAWLAAA